MSGDFEEMYISLLHHLSQADLSYRICCACGRSNLYLELFPQSGACPRCRHSACEKCKRLNPLAFGLHDSTYDAHRALLSPQYIPTSTSTSTLPPPPPPPPPPLPAVISEPNQTQILGGHEDADPQGKARNEANDEQKQEMRPHGKNPKEQQPPPVSGRNKRKLNMVKCDRCRADKKCCNWNSPEKCDRCIEKGLLCSERTRVTRLRKPTSTRLSPVHNNASPSVDPSLFEERFKRWVFLKSYHKMMTKATDRLRQLEKHIKRHFDWVAIPLSANWKEFIHFVGRDLRIAVERSLGELIVGGNGLVAFPEHPLIAGQSLACLVSSLETLCPECSPKSLKPLIDQAMEGLDVCGEFGVQQHLFEEHFDLFDPDENDTAEEFRNRESERYFRLSVEIPHQAGAILESLGLSTAATYSRSLGLYHSDIACLSNLEWEPQHIDCLGRTPTHRFLDDFPNVLWATPGDFDHIIDVSWWNSQDILGRTPLHIVCQSCKHDEDVKWILEIGADPGLETVCGHTPLHYATANGQLEICKLLMEHKAMFNIGAKDRKGLTALDYAMIKRHHKVAALLIKWYGDAGLRDEIDEALKIRKQVEDGLFKPYYTW